MPAREKMEPQPKSCDAVTWRSASRKYWIVGELVYGRPAHMPTAQPVCEGGEWYWEEKAGTE